MTYDVIILGLGPVGATLANLLVGQGLRIAVVDQREDVYDKPRAITLDHEVMRIMQACGVAHDFAPLTAPHPGTHYLGVDGQTIKIFDPLPPPFPLGWAPNATFVQPQLERTLRERLQHFTSCDWFLGYSANKLVHGKDVAELTVRDANGRDRILCGRYVAACDGANSFARKSLGIGLEDLDFDEWWMVVDVNVRAPVALPAKCVQYCWPSRPATFILGPDTLRRWEIKLLPGEDPEVFGQPENVVAQLSRFVDTSAVEVWRSAVYRFHAVLAERWRDREIFLPPTRHHHFSGKGCAPAFATPPILPGNSRSSSVVMRMMVCSTAMSVSASRTSAPLSRRPRISVRLSASSILRRRVCAIKSCVRNWSVAKPRPFASATSRI
jgi:3-(3-hydroxy-phenyl)propionate hydroxylase